MAYDEDLADRIRELLGPKRGVKEKRMFGGWAFLINGNMAVGRQRAGRTAGAGCARRHGRVGAAAACQPDGDGRARSPRLAAGRPRRGKDQASAAVLGCPRDRLRQDSRAEITRTNHLMKSS